MVCNKFCSQFDTNLTPIPWTSTLKITFTFNIMQYYIRNWQFWLVTSHSNIASREPASVLPSSFIVLAFVALQFASGYFRCLKFVGKFVLSSSSKINVSRGYVKHPINPNKQSISKSFIFVRATASSLYNR